MKIAIQGLAGSFHHQAATRLLSNDINLLECQTFSQVFEAVSAGVADRGLTAIENSLFGSINDTYDLLQKHDVWITSEAYEHVTFGLFGLPGSSLESIKDVYSQAPALAECREFLAEHVPSASQHELFDTAASAKHVALAKDPNKAAVCSYKAGELHGLVALADNIEDNKHNYTRFVLLSKHRPTLLTANKASILLKTDHSSGALHKALGCFAQQGINLSKLESRPIPGAQWNYVFYIDFEAALNSPEAVKALAGLEELGYRVVALGSYERSELPALGS